MNGATVFQMVSGLGDAFGGSYSSARKQAQEEEAPDVLNNLQTAVAAARGGGSFGDMAQSYKSGTAPAVSAGSSLPTFAQGTDIGRYASAIQSNESGGKYGIVGPTHKKYGRALGAYQVMESNLPSWSKEAVGREVSPEEFLRSPQIQDAVFQTKFGQSVAKYGNPQDAASVWFTGRPLAQGANAKDVLGTTGMEYVRRFNSALGKAPTGTAPALPATAMQMPAGAGGRTAPTQVASAEPDAANLPAAGAKPAGFVIPEGGASTAAPQATAGFGGAGGGTRMTPELQTALNAAWRNPNTRAVASQIFEQLLKGQDSGWKFEANVNGQAAWINERDGRVLPIGQRKSEDFTLSEGQQRFDATGQRIAGVEKQPEAYTLSPGQQRMRGDQVVAALPDRDKSADSESRLRGEFTKNLGTFNEVQDGYRRLIAATEQREANPDSISPASDIALIFGYMKMLDPGSVVREGEYATAQNAASIPERVRNAYNKAIQGEFLSDNQRQDFVDTAGRLYGQARQGAEQVATRYRDLAAGQGLDEKRVVALPDALVAPKIARRAEPKSGSDGPKTENGAKARPQRVEGGRPPDGYTWETYLAEAQQVARERPDLRPQIEERLAKAGIAPERLGR